MRRFATTALFTALDLSRAERMLIARDRRILIFSAAATIGLVALYIFGKSTARW
ncbi:hypothetical protein JJB98_21400 [Bradyrhizobium diazoefficiens]|nr:hypothetical protein [Bradyrhizobium diazoefficiens]QQO22309.1 hypothetical protein JJB98_21400 [Bradyrhizobium diazoefficiens]